ncbi:hypothetical protein [Rhizobium paknamense]|uniref:Uncharacterized protein n=1 Tax=Rhizobium paknamense TaxID=1206817 RepID=A0ABU0I954_9HYPH|nr:hypothetical protein [Rhizobium paknamense]MDQ0454771.1 hypothetical protein [Rhizobium paknamense]
MNSKGRVPGKETTALFLELPKREQGGRDGTYTFTQYPGRQRRIPVRCSHAVYLEHFPKKWEPVFRAEMRKNKKLQRFSVSMKH